ncbi:MAG: hypothetical protein HQ577_03310 [Dehalococcoidia bacterium]|nr:hypothetical protein [Dehalococcoidia bacterium]
MDGPIKLSGKAMPELVDKGKLKRADVLVTRSKGSLLGWLIRFGTRSYWNHAAMVYVIRNPELGYDSTFIIESGGGGIDIHNIAHYFERPKKYDVGIKRLEKDWFQNDMNDGDGGLRFRRKVRGFALEEIDDKYNHRLIVDIARKILRQLVLAAIFPWLRWKEPSQRRARVPGIASRLDINAYICSGFVQWAYYRGVGKVLEETGDTDNQKLQDVIFNPEVGHDDSEEVLLSTTPADLANSDKLTWKYIVKDGNVWEVSGQNDADSVLGKN